MAPRRRAVTFENLIRGLHDELMSLGWVSRHDMWDRLKRQYSSVVLNILRTTFSDQDLLYGTQVVGRACDCPIVLEDRPRPRKRQRTLVEMFSNQS